MLEALLLRTSEDDKPRHSTDYYIQLAASVFIASLFFTGIAALMTQHLIPLKIAGTNLGGIMTVLIATIALSYPLTNYIRRWDKEELARKWSAPSILRRHLYEAT
ncbi:MAG: hypothetical protein SVU32_03915, partial [Candidatus Nanohaloarchaea archaeon]|nr:hypothetical protein [Candidatus Nanohaloarchaea archaeon]